MSPPRVLGIVLAGGAGTRLGAGVPKAWARIAGRMMVERAVETLLAVCDEVVVTAPRSLALPSGSAPRADDPPGAAGPLAGIVGGWRAAPDWTAIVLGVDFPLVRPDLLRALLGRLGAHDAVIPHPGGRAQPLVAIYAPRVREVFEAALASGERAVTRAVASLEADRPGDDVLSSLEGGRSALMNVNTREDLRRAQRWFP